MSVDRNILFRPILFTLLLVAVFSSPGLADGILDLRVTISLDIPPYVMNHAANGLEVDIMRQALAGHPLHFSQRPYQELQTAIPKQLADVSVGVQAHDSRVNYSVDFITFVNYAIGKKTDGLRINKVADLRGHQVLTWENAY